VEAASIYAPRMSPEETTAVVIYTDSFRISGRIALMPGARLTDFVRHAPPFIAVTEVSVCDRAGNGVFDADFLDVGSAWIELIVPAALMRTARPAGGGARGARRTAVKKPTARRSRVRR